MDFVDTSYLAAVTLAGCGARALVRGLPDNWRMRLGASLPDQRPGWIWVQAVSVGELMLAEGILGRLLAAGHRVHVTTGTAAGLKLLEQRLPGWDRGPGASPGAPFPWTMPPGWHPSCAIRPGPSSPWKRRSGPTCCGSSRPGGFPPAS